MKIVIDGVRQTQAAQEAVSVLQEAGFYVGDYSIATESESSTFGLNLELSIPEEERPLEEI